jgi:long-chain acyl-CoA synthetase
MTASGVVPTISRATASGGPRPGKAGTIAAMFFDMVRRFDKPNAMLVKRDGVWQPISHKTFAARVRRIAFGLGDLGIARGDHVGIIAENSPEWAITDFACLTSGIVDVPVYPTLPASQAAHILRDSGVVACFVSTAEQAEKLAEVRGTLPLLRKVISFVSPAPPGADMTLDELEADGLALETPEHIAHHEREAMATEPGDLATIIYTSGTTGEPKGTMLSHDNLFSNVQACSTLVPTAPDDISLSFLPMSHSFERSTGHLLMHANGVTVAFAESIDLLVANFSEVRPTVVTSVPRIYEKIYARVLENAQSGGAIKKRIFYWARAVGEKWTDQRLAGKTPGGLLALQYMIADKLVFSKLRARVGGRLRLFVSGGAPLAPEINKFFYSAGLQILEGYGLTETSPVITVNRVDAFRIGTVGRPIPGVEVRIAADGEILTRGPHVMQGYFNKPEATAEAIDNSGWFHTGDIGELEDDFLRITDRKKDIIVTAGGKNVAPQPIEGLARGNKYVSQAVMIGDKRKFPLMLIVPNVEQLERWARFKNIPSQSRAELIANPTTQAKMEKEVFGVLEGLAHFEKPKKIVLLENDFSIETGELTPKLSVKRKVVDKKYKSLIDAAYAESH